jgi:multidrug efflux system outer membrane protein
VGEPISSTHYTSHLYSASLGFTSYELDLFGRIRSLTRAQYQTFLSQVETRRSTQISLVAEVANDDITLLADQEQLKLANQTLEAQGKSYALSKALFDQGTSTLLALREAETTVDTAKASVAQYTRQVAQDENALTLVVGAPIPDDLPPGGDLATESIMADLPAGVPSSLLTQRPDIMAAEHTLLAENAQIGAARAAFFPSISLTGSGGVESVTLNKLFTPAAELWTFAPQITLPIFSGGENRANLDYAKVEKRIEIANYEKTIQTAFREVSDGLAARGTYLDQLAAEQQLVDAYADAYRLSTMRFQAGVDTYLSALTTQQSLFQSEQTLVSLKAAQLQNLVTLYKALGGGWYAATQAAPAAGG